MFLASVCVDVIYKRSPSVYCYRVQYVDGVAAELCEPVNGMATFGKNDSAKWGLVPNPDGSFTLYRAVSLDEAPFSVERIER